MKHKAEHKVESGLLLDVVIRKRTTIFKLLASKNEVLLIRRDAFFVLDLLFGVVNGIRGLDIERDGLPSKGLHEDLHTATRAEHEVLRKRIELEGYPVFE
jgi:hypothetical protein